MSTVGLSAAPREPIVVWVGKERAASAGGCAGAPAPADAAPADAETRYMRLQPPLPADALVDELSQRAAAALFPGVPPTDVDLFLVARGEGVGKPTPAAERAATLLGDPTAALVDAGVGTGSWLLVRLLAPAAAAGAGASLPPPLPPAHVPRGPACARALSVSEVAGPMFEHEAREALGAIFREACPWATDASRLLSRTLDRDGNAREADVMCYVEGDALGPCVAVPDSGVAVVVPVADAAPPLPAVALRADVRFSPADATRVGPHKYFIAEVYSGANEKTMVAKVRQLETLCEFLRARWADQHGSEGAADGAPAVDDASQLLGAVALVFSAGEAPRRLVQSQALDLVSRTAVGANLARLRAAGRLLVVVLDKTQSPATFFQRAVAAELGRLATIPEDVDAVRGEVRGLRGEQRAAVAGLGRLEAAVHSLLERR